ncbi:maleylpyruvate isomerase N-terminal domain-containing protein [Pseudokineococcus sp. 5B2Z-1]|uniref:maleylpyruvate isomerase N-terminal domain-containing protein n=1 Tax=Pseudokineococcus sp. 5B2Z-1 TaxID=3132744 RepID=UPI0030A9CD46
MGSGPPEPERRDDAPGGGSAGAADPAAPLSATARTVRGAVDPAAAPLSATAERSDGSAPARALLPDGLRAFTAAVDAAARADGWRLPTPSSGWDVRGVVDHVAAQHARVPQLLGLGTARPAPAGAALLGPDPRPTWRALAAASTVAWATASEDARVTLAGEDAPASELAERLLLDLVVHAWDVRAGLAADGRGGSGDVGGSGAAVEHCLAWVRAHQRLLADSGRFGTPAEPRSADPLDQLLALVGRRP